MSAAGDTAVAAVAAAAELAAEAGGSAAAWDSAGRLPVPVRRRMAEAGLFAPDVAPE
ncbi:acyl-CoA dehydrogenase, partial [Streptomyces cacaoi]|nr:acyl-CoA dehydrogenase [Streptomyces cacaoi]